MLGLPEDPGDNVESLKLDQKTSSASSSPVKLSMKMDEGDEASDSEDEVIVKKKPQKKKRLQVLDDSDSDEEQSETINSAPKGDDSNAESNVQSQSPSKKKTIQSSSENDSDSDVESSATPKGSTGKRKVLRLKLDSGSDSEDETSLSQSSNKHKETAEKPQVPRLNLDSGSDSEDEGSVSQSSDKPKETTDKRQVPRLNLDSGSDCEDEGKLSQSSDKPKETAEKRQVPRLNLDSGSDSEDEQSLSSSLKNPGKTEEKQKVKRLDLDSGPDSEDEQNSSKAPKKVAGSDNEGSSSSSDSEGEAKEPMAWGDSSSDDEPAELSEALKKKLAKGAAKKSGGGARSSQARKSKTNAMTEIHAETQRLVRESDTRLPYHKPSPLGLAAILERTKKKQEHLHDMKRAWKTPPAVQPCLTPSTAPKQSVETSGASPSLGNPDTPPKTSPEAEKTNTSDVQCTEEADGDQLPDITNTPLSDRLKAKNISTDAIKSPTGQSLDEKLKLAEKKPEQDSGFASTSGHTSEEENSSEQLQKQSDSPEQGTEVISPNAGDKCVKSEQTPKSASKLRAALASRLPALNVAPPRLSGGPDSFIDFDAEDNDQYTPKPGVRDLMDRLMKHSGKRKAKAAKDIEMSSIQKVHDGEKEELQLTKFIVHIDGEEGDVASELNKPGGKLVNLKQTLAEKMKLKREEARKIRNEAYALDNEEGFADEEEAELTDQSDTDEEEVDEEEEVAEEREEEEEMDEGEYVAEERERKNNPFLDDEAEDEDEDDEELEEGDLRLVLNDKDDTEKGEESRDAPKSFLKAALQKTHTIQLFDDDAISESPTLSQSTNKENIELSDRPFEQLSGETIKLSQKQDEAENEFAFDLAEDDPDEKEGDAKYEGNSGNGEDDDEDTSPKLVNPNLSLLKEGSIGTDADSSYDTIIPPGQGTGRKNRKDCRTPDLFTPSSKSSMATNSTFPKGLGKMSDLPMPIEDSQDLLGSPLPGSQAESTPSDKKRTSFNFGLDDSTTYSNLLDEDGLLKEVSSSKKSSTRRQLMLEGGSDAEDESELLGLCSGKFSLSSGNTSAEAKPFAGMGGIERIIDDTQSTNDELLGLCSGQFAPAKPRTQAELSKLGLGNTQASHGNLSELLGLCSGQFTGDQSQSPISKKVIKKRKRRVITDDDDEFEVTAPGEAEEETPLDEVTLDSDQGPESDSSDDEEMVLAKKIHEKKKPKLNIKNFVDAEAELSGSEYDSDENYDIAEKDDILERCSGDEEEYDEERLQEQVGRVHLKNMIDEDKRDIRLMQEMYLPDGDLHSDGAGRLRRFRWKNIDDDSQKDMFHGSDEEEAADDDLEAQKWRLERHEREKFLSQQQEEQTADVEQDDQKVKFGKVLFRQKSERRKVLESSDVVNKKEGTTATLFKVPKTSHGSFLNRSKDTLAKIAEITRPAGANVNGPRNSKGFVFSSLLEADKQEEEVKKPGLRRSITSPASNQPATKKPRLEKSVTVPNKSKSIFQHL